MTQFLVTKRVPCKACQGIGINESYITEEVLHAVNTGADLIPISCPADAQQLTCPECYGLRFTDSQVDLVDALKSLKAV